MSQAELLRSPKYNGLVLFLVVLWTFAFVVSLVGNIRAVNANLLADARLQALVAFQKDVDYRSWNAQLGGVFTHVTPQTRPNPNLKDLVDRDIALENGDTLTMINPAYMTRLVHEQEEASSGIKGHITSLKPIRSGNRPDEWERKALLAFEEGRQEFAERVRQGDTEYFRFMRPLITAEKCLPCHEQQGYKLGDIRGGLSISIPLEPLNVLAEQDMNRLILAHLGLWSLGIVGILIAVIRINESQRKKIRADQALLESKQRYQALAEQLSQSNSMKELLLDIITHDLRNPAGVVRNVSELLKQKTEENEMVELIFQSGERIMNVLETATTLAQLSGSEAIEKSPHSLVAIIQKICREYEDVIRDQDMILRQDLPDECTGIVNPIIGEVFENFINNATKYGSSGTYIDVALRESHEHILFTVKDHGRTIPDAERIRIFERNVQLDQEGRKGRGLGLAIVKRVAEAHQGEVWVEPNHPQGNIFCLKIPKG